MDKAAIKTVIDKYLGEIYALRTKHSKKDLESGIVRIMPLLDEGSPYFYKCSAVLTMDYYYRLATGDWHPRIISRSTITSILMSTGKSRRPPSWRMQAPGWFTASMCCC